MGSIPVTIIGVMTYSGLEVGGGPMPGGPTPEHPIAPGGPPPGGYPAHPIAPGGQPPGIWPSPGYPAHPIAPGGPPPGVWPGPGQPPGIWGGAPIGPNPPYPDQGLPGKPPGIWGGGNMPVPTPPIYLPPGTIPGAKPEHPIYIPPSIWPSPGVPTHPIVLPPPGSPPDQKPEVLANWDVKAAWVPSSGWVTVIVPTESHPGVPTPSKT
jgi:hypothetical protein